MEEQEPVFDWHTDMNNVDPDAADLKKGLYNVRVLSSNWVPDNVSKATGKPDPYIRVSFQIVQNGGVTGRPFSEFFRPENDWKVRGLKKIQLVTGIGWEPGDTFPTYFERLATADPPAIFRASLWTKDGNIKMGWESVQEAVDEGVTSMQLV